VSRDKVLITGATGHLGHYATHAWSRRGYEVVAVSRSGQIPRVPFGQSPGSGLVRGLSVDLGSEGAVSVLARELGRDVALIHLAAWHPPSTAHSTVADRGMLIEFNVLGTQRVLDAARVSGGVRVVVYSSSFEVFGVPAGEAPVTENSPTRPFSDYGATKLAGEDHLFAFAAEESVPAIALRMPAIYGPGETVSRALPNFLRSVHEGRRPRILGDGLDRRDQLHAADGALSIECAVSAAVTGVYNISDGGSHSVLSLAETAMLAGGMTGKPELHPAQKARFDFHMSIEKARRELGFEPRVTLLDGMKEQLRWLRSLEAERQ
jgi:nucleoside-diphosphate-sugar epimerase